VALSLGPDPSIRAIIWPRGDIAALDQQRVGSTF
jgi:hypothetical protein